MYGRQNWIDEDYYGWGSAGPRWGGGWGRGLGRGWGRGRGFGGGFGGGGRGWRHWYRATGLPGWARAGWGVNWPDGTARISETEELTVLKEQAEAINGTLAEINQRIKDLESGRSPKEEV